MNTFFYSPKAAGCKDSCLYYTCPQRCLAVLREIAVLKDMMVLHGNLHSVRPFDIGLRSGDMMILFASGCHELEQLIGMRDIFESFRVILILGGDEFLSDYRFHQLRPRFTVSLNANMSELESVVNRMMLVSASENE